MSDYNRKNGSGLEDKEVSMASNFNPNKARYDLQKTFGTVKDPDLSMDKYNQDVTSGRPQYDEQGNVIALGGMPVNNGQVLASNPSSMSSAEYYNRLENPNALDRNVPSKLQPQSGSLGADVDSPAFAGIRNTVKGLDNTDYNQAQKDVDARNMLQNNPSLGQGAPPPSPMPSPYMQPQTIPVAGGPAMMKPQIQTTDNMPLGNGAPPPSIKGPTQNLAQQMNQPLDDEDMRALGLMPK